MHNDVLASLDYAVEQKEGFSLIIGEPGTGKTTILKIFIDRWKEKAEIALIMTPRLSPEELLQAILDDLNIHIETLKSCCRLYWMTLISTLKQRTRTKCSRSSGISS